MLGLAGFFLLTQTGCVYRLGASEGAGVGVGLLNANRDTACYANVFQSDERRQSVWFRDGYARLEIPPFKGCSVDLGPVRIRRRSQEDETSVLIGEGWKAVKRVRLGELYRCPRDFGGNDMVDVAE